MLCTEKMYMDQNIITVCLISILGKFIMSASNDTTILIWDLKGEVLTTINTNQMNNAYATVSPCGRSALCSYF